jgi:hypothetical protein
MTKPLAVRRASPLPDIQDNHPRVPAKQTQPEARRPRTPSRRPEPTWPKSHVTSSPP